MCRRFFIGLKPFRSVQTIAGLSDIGWGWGGGVVLGKIDVAVAVVVLQG